MRGALTGSAAVHFLLLALLLLFRPPLGRMVRGPDAVQVALVDPSMLAVPRPAPAPPPEARKSEPPPEPEAIRIEKPRRAPERRREETPAETTPPAETPPEPQPAVPYTAIGNAGLSGAVSVDGPPFEFSYYLQLIRSRVGQAWAPPAGLVSGGQPIRAVVRFRIARNGAIRGLSMESASGVEFFDRAALRAVQLSDPMPPLPMGYPGTDLGVHFGFEYVQP